MMLAYAIGRIGCQISGDGDWGIAADLAAKPGWLPDLALGADLRGQYRRRRQIPPPGVYPTPIYEVAHELSSRSRMLWRLRRHAHASGWLFCLYLLLAGVERLARRAHPREHHLHADRSQASCRAHHPAAQLMRDSSASSSKFAVPADVGSEVAALTPSRRAADNTASTDAVAMFA